MEEQFDRNLSKKIIELFDDYEDDSADLGWEKLREKYPVQSPRPILWTWIGSAAAVLIVVSALLLFINTPQDVPQQVAENTNTQQPAAAPLQENESTDAAATPPQEAPARQQTVAANVPVSNNISQSSIAKRSLKEAQAYSESPVILSASTELPASTETTSQVNNEVAQETPVTENIAANNNQEAIVKKAPAEEKIQQLFASDDNDEADKEEKMVDFGLFAGTYLSYAKGSENQFNVGAGITSDIRIAKNLKLSTGIAIMQNTLNYEQNIPPVAMYISEKLQMLNPPAANSVQQASGYSANMVGLDIPVNIKYEFNSNKNSFFVSAGFSSNTFINESYTYRYTNTKSPGLMAQPEEEKMSKHFNNFNFAKTLNLSFGSGYRLGKHHLFVEPFLKYPLDGMGEQNLQFGSGGINLRLNLQSSSD